MFAVGDLDESGGEFCLDQDSRTPSSAVFNNIHYQFSYFFPK
jgi:hypothetical protein